MVAQETLRELLVQSVEARGYALDEFATFANGEWQRREVATGTRVLVILKRFELEEYVRGAAAFVDALDARARDAWYRAFTRTSFLVGDPARIPERHVRLFTYRTPDVAWVWSCGERATLGLRRLLKPLRTAGAAEVAPVVECALGSGDRRELCLATAGLALEDYLVNLNHALCESLISGAMSGEDRLIIKNVPEVESLPPDCPYVRVVPDPADAERVKAVAYLAAA